MRTSAIFGEKNSDFSKFMMCPKGQGKRRVEPVRSFYEKEGQFFAFLCGRPLWTDLNKFSEVKLAKLSSVLIFLLFQAFVEKADIVSEREPTFIYTNLQGPNGIIFLDWNEKMQSQKRFGVNFFHG